MNKTPDRLHATVRRRQLDGLIRGVKSELVHYFWVVACLLVAHQLGLSGIRPFHAAVLVAAGLSWTTCYYLVCRRLILSNRRYRPRLAVNLVTLVDSLFLLSLLVLDRFSFLSAAIMITSLVLNLVFFAQAVGAVGTWWRTGALIVIYGGAYFLTPKSAASLEQDQFLLVLLVVAVLGVMMSVVAHASQQQKRTIAALLAQQKRRAEDLVVYSAELEEASLQDGLTGVANRRAFDRVLRGEFGRVERYRTAASSSTAARPQTGRLSLILLDVDHFKAYNDHFGHLAGDDCLRHVAAAMRDALKRPGDHLARYGGEEFAAVLPDTDLEGAVVVAQRVLAAVRALELPHPESSAGPFVTLSAGVADAPNAAGDHASSLVERADQALYRAKEGGRDRVEVAGESVPDKASA